MPWGIVHSKVKICYGHAASRSQNCNTDAQAPGFVLAGLPRPTKFKATRHGKVYKWPKWHTLRLHNKWAVLHFCVDVGVLQSKAPVSVSTADMGIMHKGRMGRRSAAAPQGACGAYRAARWQCISKGARGCTLSEGCISALRCKGGMLPHVKQHHRKRIMLYVLVHKVTLVPGWYYAANDDDL